MRNAPQVSTPRVATAAPTFRTIVIYLCAAIGGFVAAIADIVQKEEASAIVKITSVSARHMQLVLQPIWILLGLVILATVLCFVFQPRDRKASFSVGIGIIALIMTVTPYKQPLTGLPSNITPGNTSILHHQYDQLAMTTGYGYLTIANDNLDSIRTPISFKIMNHTDTATIATVSIFDKSNQQEYRQRNYLNSNSATIFPFAVSQYAVGNEIAYSLDIDGVTMIRANLDVQPDYNFVRLDITEEMIAKAKREGIFGGENSAIRKLGRTLGKSFAW